MERPAIITTRRAAQATLGCAALLLIACESSTGPEPRIDPEPRTDSEVLFLQAVTPLTLVGVVAAELTPTPVVRLLHNDGTPAPGVAVSFTASGAGTVISSAAVTDNEGRASPGAWRSDAAAGVQTLAARAGDRTVTFTAQVQAGPIEALLDFAGNAQTGSVREILPGRLRVRAVDGFGNPIAGATVRFVVVEGGGAIADDIALTGIDGVATSGMWTLGPIIGEQRVSAQSGPAQFVFSAVASPVDACDPDACGRMAYVSGNAIFTLDRYTGRVQQLTPSGRDLQPSWSPDGGVHIAFARFGSDWMSSDIWVMNPDGTGQTQVTSGGVYHSPTWSPDGDALAFAGDWWLCVYECAIYVQELAPGSEPRRIAPMGADPAWSPDGSRIAFVALSGDDGYHSLRTVEPDGSGLVEVTPIDEGAIFGPEWSPDGTLIAFSKCMRGVCEVHTVRPDGSDLRRVTNVGNAGSPAWSADGTRIAFTIWSAGVSSIAMISAAGGAVTTLIASAHSPAWRP